MINADDDVSWIYQAYKNRRKLRILSGGLYLLKHQEGHEAEVNDCYWKLRNIAEAGEDLRVQNGRHSDASEKMSSAHKCDDSTVTDERNAILFTKAKIKEVREKLGEMKQTSSAIKKGLGSRFSRVFRPLEDAQQDLEQHINDHENNKNALDRCFGYKNEHGTFKRQSCDQYLGYVRRIYDRISLPINGNGMRLPSLLEQVDTYRVALKQALPTITKEREALESRIATLRRPWLSRWLSRK